MFVRQNQQQFRNSNADVQIFYAPAQNGEYECTWNKPPGVSFVYMLLIGGGGSGNAGGGGTSGGSGSVTRWFGSAQNVPNVLQIGVGRGGGYTTIPENGGITRVYYYNNGNQTLLTAAQGAYTGSGGATTAAGVFANSGFYANTAGQNGSTSSVSASTVTFLSGGSGGTSLNANYGYGITVPSSGNTGDGFFMLQPMIVSCGSLGAGQAGIGSGGGKGTSVGGVGGNGLVLIASW